jgi:hypothetical protein
MTSRVSLRLLRPFLVDASHGRRSHCSLGPWRPTWNSHNAPPLTQLVQPERGDPKTAQGWSDVSVANVAQLWVGERRNGAVERLVWHRDQIDRRPQINEFRGGQMRPRPRAAERPSVCSAWVSGQFPPAHRRFVPRTGLSSGRPLEGYSGHLTATTRKHDPVRSSHGHRSQCDARTPNSKLDRAPVPRSFHARGHVPRFLTETKTCMACTSKQNRNPHIPKPIDFRTHSLGQGGPAARPGCSGGSVDIGWTAV